jgi:antitoxin component YwqK of YwqJK toxin-antitoxin module
MLVQRGYYSNGKEDGDWEFFDERGHKNYSVNIDKGKE